jgi:hypothetical protein
MSALKCDGIKQELDVHSNNHEFSFNGPTNPDEVEEINTEIPKVRKVKEGKTL